MPIIKQSETIPEGVSALLSFIIVDSQGAPMQASLTTLTLSYYDKASLEIINSRDNQDVLNTNNVIFGSESLGAVVCSFLASSRTIRRNDGNWLLTSLNVGDQIVVSGTLSNDGMLSITGVSVTDIIVSESLVDEANVSAIFGVPGKLRWEVQPTDSVILDGRKELEDHIALFSWTWDAGTRRASQEIEITVENVSLYP